MAECTILIWTMELNLTSTDYSHNHGEMATYVQFWFTLHLVTCKGWFTVSSCLECTESLEPTVFVCQCQTGPLKWYAQHNKLIHKANTFLKPPKVILCFTHILQFKNGTLKGHGSKQFSAQDTRIRHKVTYLPFKNPAIQNDTTLATWANALVVNFYH